MCVEVVAPESSSDAPSCSETGGEAVSEYTDSDEREDSEDDREASDRGGSVSEEWRAGVRCVMGWSKS